ncbi:MAG: hypothetical protein JRJ03_17230 [Deltaproteobacteria bacterium]|nr:hypothetical protein [Deltaproteobacteria bacterium]
MFIYSTMVRPIFWTVMGLIYALTIAGAPIWAEDLGLAMTWWKWILVALWYLLLSFTFAGSFTLLAEKEPGAWYRFLGSHLALCVILGAVIWFLI